jgi:hypothetical protein
MRVEEFKKKYDDKPEPPDWPKQGGFAKAYKGYHLKI